MTPFCNAVIGDPSPNVQLQLFDALIILLTHENSSPLIIPRFFTGFFFFLTCIFILFNRNGGYNFFTNY
jgi:hypothetical protein